MNDDSYKKMLISAWELERELIELLEECLSKLYPERKEMAISSLKQNIEMMDYNGCLQNLNYMERMMNPAEKTEG